MRTKTVSLEKFDFGDLDNALFHPVVDYITIKGQDRDLRESFIARGEVIKQCEGEMNAVMRKIDTIKQNLVR